MSSYSNPKPPPPNMIQCVVGWFMRRLRPCGTRPASQPRSTHLSTHPHLHQHFVFSRAVTLLTLPLHKTVTVWASKQLLPLVLSCSLVENILLAIHSQDTILECALPLVLDALNLVIHAEHDVAQAFIVHFIIITVLVGVIQV